MILRIKITLLFTVLFIGAFAQKKELNSITESELKAHLEFIASDYMQGRDFGTTVPGLELTAEYLRTQCAKMGIKPGVENYYQTFEMVSAKPDFEKTCLKIKDRTGNETFKSSDVFSFSNSIENDTLTGDIVFAGYGWTDESRDYNDLEGVDLKDKYVMVMTRNREIAIDTTLSSSTSIEMSKLQWLFKTGTKGVIFVQDPLNPDKSWFEMVKGYVSGGVYTRKGSERSFFPGNIIFASNEIADKILEEKGKSLLDLQTEINKSGKPQSFEIEKFSVEIQLVSDTQPVDGTNVIAIVEGSGPVLKNECIVFSAHYDHVGVAQNGEIYNGADDNGSGTVALLEIAEAFNNMKKKPKRSIVFAWVTAEEKGLIGSEYYSENPIIPLENTLLNINLDMVGRVASEGAVTEGVGEKSLIGKDGLYIVSGKQSSELIEISDKICKDLNLEPNGDLSEAFLSRSDYFHFYKNGIPVLGLSTGLHEDYHKTTDELHKIDYNKMKRISDYCFLVANKIANQKKRIVVDNPVTKQ